ncbi:hypothetical protein C8R44DRAFT_751077 [Mycena epipterygia]|nr:hypothetical protein C8R44DRAFT_751077 [Mycena epipterygia]
MQPLQRRELGERPESRSQVRPVEPVELVDGVDDEHDERRGAPRPCTSVGVERGPVKFKWMVRLCSSSSHTKLETNNATGLQTLQAADGLRMWREEIRENGEILASYCRAKSRMTILVEWSRIPSNALQIAKIVVSNGMERWKKVAMFPELLVMKRADIKRRQEVLPRGPPALLSPVRLLKHGGSWDSSCVVLE